MLCDGEHLLFSQAAQPQAIFKRDHSRSVNDSPSWSSRCNSEASTAAQDDVASCGILLNNQLRMPPPVIISNRCRRATYVRQSAFWQYIHFGIPLFCAAVAAALGTRFRILVLIPATVLVLVTTISFGIAARWGFGEVATTLLISLVALQVGYLAGSLVSHFVSAVHLKPRDRWIPRYHL